MTVLQISTSHEYYGDVTESEAADMAKTIAERVAAVYPEIEIEIVAGPATRDSYDEREAEIQQYVNDNWPDWV